jgi:UDP-N-acetylmuramyl pentapeptide phosphotransferase/UDP-N-acetylglucosamine-1-phosphate transferase
VEAWPDARGKAMMGDVGSNLLGAGAGLAAVIELPVWGRIVLFALLAALNLAAERVSLSAVIERSPILRALDRRLGVRS